MHRNTYLLVSILAIFAALLVGVNLGKKLQKPAVPTAVTQAAPTPTPTITIQTYTDTYCGFSLDVPSTFTVLENASGSAILSAADKSQSMTLTCQKNIPRPPLPTTQIETLTLSAANGASVSAKLYHDATAKDGTPIDEVIFRHPGNGMDDFITGFGKDFDAAIQTIQILP